jgi:dTDP-4-amino-4,6-dideoxygalactose transaminase
LAPESLTFIQAALESGKTAGNGPFTRQCQAFFQERYGFKSVLMTHSCTAALEMAALLLDIGPGDEVIMPSYTFVSTANAFILRGAKVVFADLEPLTPNIDPQSVASLVTPRTKAIVVVHYAGIACNMSAIMDIASQHKIWVIEDAAQAIDAFYQGRPLGGIGHLAAFSFHETKNIASGEGGMLVINEMQFIERAAILWEKGTNRNAFLHGQVDKYSWVDLGSSFLMSELSAALLWAQLQHIDYIQTKRKQIWSVYFEALSDLGIELPEVPEYAAHNAHIFYVVAKSQKERDQWIKQLKQTGIPAYFHYLPLHSSPFFVSQYDGPALPITDRFANGLLRLPLYVDLPDTIIAQVAQTISVSEKI